MTVGVAPFIFQQDVVLKVEETPRSDLAMDDDQDVSTSQLAKQVYSLEISQCRLETPPWPSGRVLICSGESTLGAGDISVRVGQSCSGPGGTLEVRAGSSTSNTGGSVRVAGGSGCGGGNVTAIEGGTSTQAQGECVDAIRCWHDKVRRRSYYHRLDRMGLMTTMLKVMGIFACVPADVNSGQSGAIQAHWGFRWVNVWSHRATGGNLGPWAWR